MQQEFRTVWWEDDAVCLIDQRLLPTDVQIIVCRQVDDVAYAIRSMQVRGAPAIGCTAAYGIALAAQIAATQRPSSDITAMLQQLTSAKTLLDAQRPTAVNLSWATARMIQSVRQFVAQQRVESRDDLTASALARWALNEAHAILSEDLAMCHAIGRHGAPLIPERGHVLTHCNAGGLATAGYGTALAPLRTAAEQGRTLHVFVDETRPFLQGARLTAWELQQANIPLTLITDSMAGYVMQRGAVDCVIVGADRIVRNGDVANKIGTYSLAVLAHAHHLPFYVAAPSSTIDLSLASGDDIPIEQRDSSEVTSLAGIQIAPVGVQAMHPAFDVTPHRLVTAIITEQGVIYPPFTQQLALIQAHPA